jgi:hypothetical protein
MRNPISAGDTIDVEDGIGKKIEKDAKTATNPNRTDGEDIERETSVGETDMTRLTLQTAGARIKIDRGVDRIGRIEVGIMMDP